MLLVGKDQQDIRSPVSLGAKPELGSAHCHQPDDKDSDCSASQVRKHGLAPVCVSPWSLNVRSPRPGKTLGRFGRATFIDSESVTIADPIAA